MKFLYTLAFLFGADNWKIENLPAEIDESLGRFDKTNTYILDLGCGEGRECISLAARGWQVLGIDFISLAIRRAKKAAQQANLSEKTRFYVGDVSKLSVLDLPEIHFAYDIGCFHLLPAEKIESYISGLDEILVDKGLFLLNAFTPRYKGNKKTGYNAEEIKSLFSPIFNIDRVEEHSYWRFPANWYWMTKR